MHLENCSKHEELTITIQTINATPFNYWINGGTNRIFHGLQREISQMLAACHANYCYSLSKCNPQGVFWCFQHVVQSNSPKQHVK
jgi:spore coat protein U-like protein